MHEMLWKFHPHATHWNSTHVKPKFHACEQTQRPRLGHAMGKLHLISSLTFLKITRTSRTLPLHFPWVHAKSEFSPHTPFSLKERARNSLLSLLSNPWVYTLKERQDSILILLHTLSKLIGQKRIDPLW